MKKNYLWGIAACAALGFLLYSPWTLHLRPSDFGVIRSGLSIVLGLVLCIAFLYCLLQLLRLPAAPRLPGRRRNADFRGRKEERELRALLSGHEKRQIVGKIAAAAKAQLDLAANRIQNLRDVLGNRFGATSLTFSRYDATITEGQQRIFGNMRALAMRMQEFDEREYASLASGIATGAYRRSPVDARLQEDRLLLLADRLKDMEEILDTNEQMLKMLDQCAKELIALGDAQKDRENEAIMQEIKDLVETTKYYS